LKKLLILLSFAAVLLAASAPAAAAASPFKDVKDRHWASKAIQWAYNKGLVSGYSDGTFKPDRSITEAQFAAMLVRFDCKSPASYPARRGEHQAMGNYRYLDKYFLPLKGLAKRSAIDAPVLRSQAARIAAAYQGTDLSKHEAVYYLYEKDLADGTTGKNDYKDFRPNENLSRAEVASLLYRMSLTDSSCGIKGLSAKATGSDNWKYDYPANFVENGDQSFEPPVKPPVANKPQPNPVDIDIEHATLTANGKDSTFITFTFRDKNGNLIPYDKEIPFDIQSSAGSVLSVPDDPKGYYKEDPAQYQKGSVSKAAYGTRELRVYSDGPEVTVKVTAPAAGKKITDTITAIPVAASNSYQLSSASASLTYEPKAELQLKTEDNGDGKTYLTAILAYPGGDRAYGFNGYLQLEAPSGLSFSTVNAEFYNGVASVSFPTPRFTLKDVLRAKAVSRASSVDPALNPAVNTWFKLPLDYAAPLSADAACTAEKPEVAFVIDSSGSMMRNDPKRERVSRTTEFINALNVPDNIATHFTNSGMYLERGTPSRVIPSLSYIRQSGGTNIADGLKQAFSRFATTRQKAVILLTDGKSAETAILQQAAEAKSKGIRIFTIGLGKDVNEELLRRISNETGGTYFSIHEATNLSLVYQAILDSMSCGVPQPTCSALESVFLSPQVEVRGNDLLMSTNASNVCGQIGKVIVRFSSLSGDLDYQLIHRGQDYYTLTKGIYEITDFALQNTAVFYAFDLNGNQIGKKSVNILRH